MNQHINDDDSDLSLIFTNAKIRCHSNIIKNIPFFDMILRNNNNETKNNMINLIEYDYIITLIYLEYVYGNRMIVKTIKFEYLCELISISDKYMDYTRLDNLIQIFIDRINYDTIETAIIFLSHLDNNNLNPLLFSRAKNTISNFILKSEISYEIFSVEAIDCLMKYDIPELIKIHAALKYKFMHPSYIVNFDLNLLNSNTPFVNKIIDDIIKTNDDILITSLLSFIKCHAKIKDNESKPIDCDEFDQDKLSFDKNMIYDGDKNWTLMLTNIKLSKYIIDKDMKCMLVFKLDISDKINAKSINVLTLICNKFINSHNLKVEPIIKWLNTGRSILLCKIENELEIFSCDDEKLLISDLCDNITCARLILSFETHLSEKTARIIAVPRKIYVKLHKIRKQYLE